MSISFGPERWEKVKKTYDLWWEGKLERPVIGVQSYSKKTDRPHPGIPLLSQKNCMDLSVSPDEIIDRIDYELSQITFLGDCFPYFNMDCFGPGVAAAFCGAKMGNSSGGGIWFSPSEKLPAKDLHLEYNGDNVWLNRIKEIYRAGMARWQGQVLMGMTDLGGTLDILSSFLTPEELLLDLYDCPEEIDRLVNEIRDLWLRFYNELNDILQPVNPGYSDWSSIYSRKPCYILQCDFSYMISPKMFERFVLPDIEEMCRKIPYAFYHLDGVGQLPHLDYLLGLDNLRGIQWVPGEGNPSQMHWPEVYRKIQSAGKLTQIWSGFDAIDAIANQTGSYKGIQHRVMTISGDQEYQIRKQLGKYGIE